MQIVIDIPIDAYNDLIEYGYRNLGSFDCGNILKAVTKGTPLLKNHGRMTDADKMLDEIKTEIASWIKGPAAYLPNYEAYKMCLEAIAAVGEKRMKEYCLNVSSDPVPAEGEE